MKNILIVDDSATASYVLRQFLEQLGHKVQMAENGVRAIIAAHQFKPDLVIMDLVMPKMDGFKATRLIKHDPRLKHIPVIIYSSKSEKQDKHWAKLQGADGYLTKPINREQLETVMNQVLTRKKQSATTI